jgi:hypothetical protein
LTSCGLNVQTFVIVTCVVIKNISIKLETLIWLPPHVDYDTWSLETLNKAFFEANKLEKPTPQKYL